MAKDEKIANEILKTAKANAAKLQRPIEDDDDDDMEGIGDQVNAGSKNEYRAYIDFTSEEGNLYQGYVTFKRANLLDKIKIGAKKGEIMRRAGAEKTADLALIDPGIHYMASMAAALDVVMIKRPGWIKDPMTVNDTEIIYHVFEKYDEWVDSFRKQSASEASEDSGATKPA